MNGERFILLSFDVEEFDLPLEYGQAVSEEEQLKVGYRGLQETMNVLEKFRIEATFFTTAHFASHYREAVRTIGEKHEIASHTFYHSRFAPVDLAGSKAVLENVTGKKVTGLRMPRMQPVKAADLLSAGYTYDSSVNPTWVPGRYNNLTVPRTVYKEENILRIPSSVTPFLRIPLFWLSFKNFPYPVYRSWLRRTLTKDGYVCLYFHPWEFTTLENYKIPGYIKRGAGPRLQKRLAQLIKDVQEEGELTSMSRYATFKK